MSNFSDSLINIKRQQYSITQTLDQRRNDATTKHQNIIASDVSYNPISKERNHHYGHAAHVCKHDSQNCHT
jgi:hypothetical protein